MNSEKESQSEQLATSTVSMIYLFIFSFVKPELCGRIMWAQTQVAFNRPCNEMKGHWPGFITGTKQQLQH